MPKKDPANSPSSNGGSTLSVILAVIAAILFVMAALFFLWVASY